MSFRSDINDRFGEVHSVIKWLGVNKYFHRVSVTLVEGRTDCRHCFEGYRKLKNLRTKEVVASFCRACNGTGKVGGKIDFQVSAYKVELRNISSNVYPDGGTYVSVNGDMFWQDGTFPCVTSWREHRRGHSIIAGSSALFFNRAAGLRWGEQERARLLKETARILNRNK